MRTQAAVRDMCSLHSEVWCRVGQAGAADSGVPVQVSVLASDDACSLWRQRDRRGRLRGGITRWQWLSGICSRQVAGVCPGPLQLVL